MRLEKKDLLLLIPATLLAIAGLGPDDPWVVGPCLFLSWAAFVFVCVIHEGPRKTRAIIGIAITLVLAGVGYRRFHSIFHNPEKMNVGKAETNPNATKESEISRPPSLPLAPTKPTETPEPTKKRPPNPQRQRVFKTWAGTTSSCTAVLDGELLMKFSRNYEVAMACGFYSTIDRFKDTGISMSQTYDIRPRDIDVGTGLTIAMANAYKAIEPGLPILNVNGVPGREVRIWYEIFLLPKRMGIEKIHKLDDVEDLGGKLLPEEAVSVAVTIRIQ